jgi:hypothetical protein
MAALPKIWPFRTADDWRPPDGPGGLRKFERRSRAAEFHPPQAYSPAARPATLLLRSTVNGANAENGAASHTQRRYFTRDSGGTSFETRLDVLNPFNNINFNPVSSPVTSGAIFQATSAYRDLNNPFDPGGRLVQLSLRLNW